MGFVNLPNVTIGAVRQAIDALRDGVPPPEEIAEWLAVGQDTLARLFESSFQIIAGAGFSAHLLLGVPGAGKSHFLTRMRRLSHNLNCVTSYCVQDRTTRTTLNRPDLVYRAIIEQMRLPGVGANQDALPSVLQMWSAKALPLVSGTAPALGRLYTLEKMSLVPALPSLPRRTGLALVGYLLALEAQNQEAQQVMLNVLRGLKIENREVIDVAKGVGLTRAPVGYTPSPYDVGFWLGQLATICHLVRAAGFCGTVLLLDELESLVDLPRSNSRAKAYNVLHALLFNDYSAPGLLTAFAFTPAFVSGLKSDVAGEGNRFHKEWVLFWKNKCAEIPTISRSEARELVQKIAELHAQAYRWNPKLYIQTYIDALVDDSYKRQRAVGDLVRDCVARLDLGESAIKR